MQLRITSPILVTLAKEETKVRGRASYKAKWNSLAVFCGSSANHVCVPSFKHVVRFGEDGYNAILDSFRNNKVEGFAQVVVVNSMHDKLPRLVLVACCTYNCLIWLG